MNRNSKKGITLVELIVALTLTSVFAVLCVMLINPVERTYRSTLKIARAQLLADTIVDSIRKECDDVKHDEKMSVWIGNLGSSDDADLISSGPAIKGSSGNVLVFQRNSNYTEAIYSNAEISNTNFTNVENNPLTPSNTAHSISALDNDAKEANLKSGIVHFGYYQAKEDDRGIFPIKSYDYTNPVLASTYGNFTVDLHFENLTFSKADKYPVYVLCKVNVLEKGTVVYTRSAVISFAANGSGNGSYTPTTAPKKRDVEVRIVWDDHKNFANRPEDGVTIELWNASKTNRLGTHVVSNVRTDAPQRFKFSGIDASDGLSIVQIFNTSASGYQTTITQKANGFVITNKGSAVTLLAGPDLNNLLQKTEVLHVVFGMESDIRSRVALPSSYSKASIAGNNLTEDYKLYWVSSSKTIYIVSDDGRFIANPDCSQMFEGCKKLVSITWNDGAGDFVIDTSNTTNMASMFKYCEQITQFNLKNLVQNQCASIAGMFEDCTHGSQLNYISTWDTSAVKNMSRMFFNYGVYHDDSSDGSIDISNFDFSSCTTMKQMFMCDKSNIKTIAEIKFPHSSKDSLLNMNNVTDMEQMFYGNSKLLKITDFNCMDCQKLKTVDKMFDGCGELTELNLQYFIMPKCDIEDQYVQGKQYHAFWNCNKLTKINLDGWDISSETNIRDFFGYMPQLEYVYLRDCKTPNLQSAEGLFFHCSGLKEVYMPGFIGAKCTTIRSVFNECKVLEKLDISGWDTSGVKYMRNTFYLTNSEASTALTLDLSTWEFKSVIDISEFCYKSGISEIKFKPHGEDAPLDFDKATSIRYMFAFCSRLTKIENFNHASFASTIITYEKKLDEHGNQQKEYGSEHVFQNCSKLTSLDISGLKLPKCASVKNWFNGCSSLTRLLMNDVDLRGCSVFTDVLKNCSALTHIEMNRIDLRLATSISFLSINSVERLELSGATLTSVASLQDWFKGKTNLQYIDMSNVNLSSCKSTAWMFLNCSNLATVSMKNFKTSFQSETEHITYQGMFSGCKSIESIDLTGWETSNVSNMSSMFQGCTSLNGISMSGLITSKVSNMSSMFLGCTSLKSTVDFSDLDLSLVENMSSIYSGCTGIVTADISKMKVPVCTTVNSMFKNCSALMTVYMNEVDLSNCTNTGEIFNGCSALTDIYAKESNFVKLTNFGNISGVASLLNIDLSNSNLSGIAAGSSFSFSGKNIRTVKLNGTKTSCATLKSMFANCKKLTSVSMKNFVADETSCESMFENCFSLTTFEAGGWVVNNMKKMFFKACYYNGSDCQTYDKATIDLSGLDISEVQSFEAMFQCDKPARDEIDRLETVKFPSVAAGGNPNANKAVTFYYLFRFRKGYKKFENLGELRVNVGTLNNVSYMFSNCGVGVLDVSGMDLTGFTGTAKQMFEACTNLTTIYAAAGTDWSGVNFSDHANMFKDSPNLVGGAGTTYDSTCINKAYARVDGLNGNQGYFTAK